MEYFLCRYVILLSHSKKIKTSKLVINPVSLLLFIQTVHKPTDNKIYNTIMTSDHLAERILLY